jgi:hypothetical protein
MAYELQCSPYVQGGPVKLRKLSYIVAAASLVLLFQNCTDNYKLNTNGSGGVTSASANGAPTVSISATPSTVVVGGSTSLSISYSGVTNVSFQCVKSSDQSVVAGGPVSVNNIQVSVVINQDIACSANGVDQSGNVVQGSVDVTVDCGADTKANGACSAPVSTASSLTVVASPSTVANGGSTNLVVTDSNVSNITYSCVDDAASVVSAGAVTAASQTIPVLVTQDLNCTVSGTDANNDPITASASVSVDCGNQIKVGGVCKDFACQSVVALTASQLTNIPARTADGICYSYKIISSISSGSSSLTTVHDAEVLSRNHDMGESPDNSQHPYLMGSFQGTITLAGARVVKAAGGLDATTPILVDNYILFGIDASGSDAAASYTAMGSSDSPANLTDANGVSKLGILFQNNFVNFQPFASGGTSSLAPIDLSTVMTPNVAHTLDIRAEDCGGARALSDIYLLFQ